MLVKCSPELAAALMPFLLVIAWHGISFSRC